MPDFTDILLYALILTFGYIQIRLITQWIAISTWKTKSTTEQPPISVVIAARNMASKLRELIPTLLKQDYPEFEIVIALDRCTDDSIEVMKAFEKKYKSVRVVIIDDLPDHFSPKKYALTLGIKGASHEWMVLTDADCTPRSDKWLAQMSMEMSEKTDFILGCSPYLKEKGFLNAYIRYETFLTALNYISSTRLKIPYMGVGRNIAYRKSLFLEARGYNDYQHVMGGDDDLFVHYHAKPSRTQVVLGESSLTYSAAKSDFSSYWFQKKRHFSVGKFYTFWSRLSHAFNHLALVSFWILAILNIVFMDFMWVGIGAIVLHLFLRGLGHFYTAKKIGDGYLIGLGPIFEAIYITFVPIAVLISTFTRKVKWK